MTDITKQLQSPFKENEIEWRVQSCGISNGRPWAMVLAYVQARAIQRRLDEVFGWDGWTDEYRATEGNMICRLSVRTSEGNWIAKENGASETQVEAFKGGISGAFKRVAASGYGIGRYLYDLTENFAQCTLEKPKNMNGWNKARTKDGKTIYWQTPQLPSRALPDQDKKIDSQSIGLIKTEWLKQGLKENALNAQLKKLYGSTITGLTSEQADDFLNKLKEKKGA